MADYILGPNNSGVMAWANGEFIPNDANNVDWQTYQVWLSESNSPDPVPSCFLWQLQAVMTANQWSNVTAVVANLNNNAVTAFFSHGGNEIPADSPTALEIAALMGLDQPSATVLIAQASNVNIFSAP